MNILPKKRWHVRTKENIARVRKDEAEAAEKEKQERLRIETADREARINILKNKSKQKFLESGFTQPEQEKTVTSEHINLFENLDNAVEATNKEHDSEIKEKKEDYEKKIGYLTYLGQDTNESLQKKNWYEVPPEASRFSRSGEIKDTYDKLVLKDEDGKPKTKELDVKNGEIAWKSKQCLDPIKLFKKHCLKINNKPNTSKVTDIVSAHKHYKQKKNTPDNKEKLQKLREARLKREQGEEYRTKLFLSNLNEASTSTVVNKEQKKNKIKPKYNSQFNPELARQNYY